MVKLLDHDFSLHPDGLVSLFATGPNVLNSIGATWNLASAGSTLTAAGGWMHSSVNVDQSLDVATPANTNYHARVFIRYPLSAINTADTYDLFLQMGFNYSSTQRNLVRINPHSTNLFQTICRKHNATLGSTTNIADGPGGTPNGSNNHTAGFWLGLLKLNNTLWQTYDMGKGMRVVVPAGTADGGYTTADGYPAIQFKAATWEIQRYQIWDAVIDPATGFIDAGQFDPAIDPDLQPCLRRHMKFWSEEQPRSYLVGGWYAPNGSSDSTAWTNASQVTPGKFTDGFVYSSGTGNAGYYPAHGMIPTHDFTLGVWVEPTVNWSAVTAGAVICSFGDGASNMISITRAGANAINFIISKQLGPTIASTTLSFTFPYNLTWLAGEKRLVWLSIDSDGLGTVGIDQMSMRPGVTAFNIGARVHDCSVFEPGTTMNGLRFATGSSGARFSQLKISDFFLLSGCQYPGHTAATLPENVLTVDPTTAPPRLSLTTKHFGTLGRKNLTDWATVVAGSMGAVRIAKGTLAMPSRFDSTVSCEAPGLTPSSPWNYDINSGLWDRDLAQAFASVHFGGSDYGYVYIDTGGVPQVLQDAGAATSSYYSGSNLSGNTSNSAAWVASIPNDGTNTGTIAGHTVVLSAGTINKMAMNKVDYILYVKAYCLAHSLPFDHIIWESWNEFLSGSFWHTTAYANPTTEFMKVWNAVVDLAQTHVDANFKFCIPSTVQYHATGIPACMAAAVAAGNGAAIKAIAPHDYQGDLTAQTYQYAATAEVDRLASSVDQVVPFIHDEDQMNNIYAPGTGAPNQFLSSDRPIGGSVLSAAWTLAKIIGCARCLEMTAGVGGGVEAYILTGAKIDAAADVYQQTGLVDDSGANITAVGNAYHLGLMCAIDTPGTSGRVHGTSTYVGDPLGGHVVTVEPTGVVNILIVHLRTQQASTETLRVSLPVGYAGRSVTKYTVDDTKASYYDTAGSSIALVQESAGNLDASGDITITVRGQSVTLLQVALTGGSYATASGPVRGSGIKIGGVGIR